MSEEKVWTAALLVIGDEILSGRTQDKNVGQVAVWLNEQGIRLAAERCKIELTDQPEAEMHLSLPELKLSYRRRVARAEFDALTADLVERTIDSCRRALSDARLSPGDIDEVVLVGGSSRIPAVRARVEQFFGKKPHTELNPEEVVALGGSVKGIVPDIVERRLREKKLARETLRA